MAMDNFYDANGSMIYHSKLLLQSGWSKYGAGAEK